MWDFSAWTKTIQSCGIYFHRCRIDFFFHLHILNSCLAQGNFSGQDEVRTSNPITSVATWTFCIQQLSHLVNWKSMNFPSHNTFNHSWFSCSGKWKLCFWCDVDYTQLDWTNFCVRFYNFLHPLFSHHYHIFSTIRPVQQCVIKVNENPEELIL